MRTATVSITGISPYSQSRSHETPKLDRETPDAHEQRTWREKCHAMPDGRIFIPPMAFKQALDRAAVMLGRQIPGRGRATYGKFFVSGVLCVDPVVLPTKKDQVPHDRIYCHANGKRGSGTRVWRWFPTVPTWSGKAVYTILADEITESVFEEHVRQSGSFVGVGRFRPEVGGYYGRFRVDGIEWATV